MKNSKSRKMVAHANTPSAKAGKAQHGVILVEVLVSILIFAIGVLGLIGLYAATAKTSSDASMRADAALLADDIFAQMWLSDAATLATDFTASGAKFVSFKTDRVLPTLPGGELDVVFAATSTVTAVSGGTSPGGSGQLVQVTLRWLVPGRDATNTKSQHTARTVITPPVRY